MSSAVKLLAVSLALVCIAGGVWLLVSDRAEIASATATSDPVQPERHLATRAESLDAPDASAARPQLDTRSISSLTQDTPPSPPNGVRAAPPRRSAVVAGKVTLDDGSPIPDVTVVVMTVHGSDNFGPVQSMTQTDAKGSFRTGQLQSGQHVVSLFSPHAPAEWAQLVELADNEVREDLAFVIPSVNVIAGHVLDPDGVGVERATVQFTSMAARTTGAAKRADDTDDVRTPDVRSIAGGSFCFPVPVRGTYLVRATLPGSTNAEGRLANLADSATASIASGARHVALYLRRKLPVSGVVLWPNGDACDHAGVIAKDASGRELDITYADAHGRFVVSIIEDTIVDLFAYPAYPLGGGRQGWSMADKGPNSAKQSNVRAGRTDVELRLSKPQ
jgi:hypothetical protein